MDDAIQIRHVAFILLFHKYIDGRLNLGCSVATPLILRRLWGLIGDKVLGLLLLVQSLLGSKESLGRVTVFVYGGAGLAPRFLCGGSGEPIWGLLLDDWYIWAVG